MTHTYSYIPYVFALYCWADFTLCYNSWSEFINKSWLEAHGLAVARHDPGSYWTVSGVVDSCQHTHTRTYSIVNGTRPVHANIYRCWIDNNIFVEHCGNASQMHVSTAIAAPQWADSVHALSSKLQNKIQTEEMRKMKLTSTSLENWWWWCSRNVVMRIIFQTLLVFLLGERVLNICALVVIYMLTSLFLLKRLTNFATN